MIARQLLRRICIFVFTLFVWTCTGTPILSISECECGKSVVLRCNSSSVIEGDNFEWRKGSSHIYSSAVTGTVSGDKYLGSSTNGSVVLVILKTDVSDNGVYHCNHNFIDSNQVTLSLTCITSTSGFTSNSTSTPRPSSVSTTTVSATTVSATTEAPSSSVFRRSSGFLTIASVLGSWLSVYLRSR